jgi:hypothetical protein
MRRCFFVMNWRLLKFRGAVTIRRNRPGDVRPKKKQVRIAQRRKLGRARAPENLGTRLACAWSEPTFRGLGRRLSDDLIRLSAVR